MSQQRILITGALGHIGSRFIHGIKPGDFSKVVLLDNLLTQRYASLFNLPSKVPFVFLEQDILKVNWETLLKDIDVVLHLAAITDAASSFGKAEEVERVNFESTHLLAKACAKAGVKLILPSTTSVYGVQENLVDETCSNDHLKPQSPYAASKLKAEQALTQLGETQGLRFVTLRLGTIFGVAIGMRFHTAVNKFCWQAVMGQPVSVWRTALNQKRPYLDLTDAVEAISFVIDKDIFDKQIYNVVTVNTTVGDILDIIRRSITDLKVEYVDVAIMNQLSYEVANAKFSRLGFKFKGQLDQGIKQTIEWLKNARSLA